MSADFLAHLRAELDGLRSAGLYKSERVITTPQGATVKTADGREVINLCANNYLGLSSHPAVIEAAHEALRTHGYGMSSVRFICGTQDLHKTLEAHRTICRLRGCHPLCRRVRRQWRPVRALAR
jgi:glycine C-acetyltransferase